MKHKDFRISDVPRAIWYFLEKDRFRFLAFTGLLGVTILYEMVPPFLIGRVLDFLLGYKTSISLRPLYLVVLILVVSSALNAMLRLKSKEQTSKLAVNARYRAKVWGFERLMNFSMNWHQQENTGNKAQRIITGSETIGVWTYDFNNVILPALVHFMGALIACFILTPLISIFFFYYIFILFFFEWLYDRKISRVSDDINKSMENASGSFIEGASNILAVKALGAGTSMSSSLQERERTTQDYLHRRIKLSVHKMTFFQIHNAISWGIFILIVAFMVINGKLSVGLVLTYTQYFGNMRRTSTQFVNQIQRLIEQTSQLGRMMPIFWLDHSLRNGTMRFPFDWDQITIFNANFSYNEKSVIRDFNLKVKRGEKLGITGKSGSGKSTLLKLFLGLYHLESGELKFGNTSLSEIRSEEITSMISVVLQETELFNLPLIDNITLMRETDAAVIEQAIHISCLEEVVSRLPDGLQSKVGEKGYALSGGERQRVGIARAICKNAPILLLDEATSGLDSGIENTIMDRLMSDFSEGKTMFIVAHRISTLKDCDKVVVFSEGNIVEEGSFSELSTREGGLFRKMFEQQALV